LLARYGAPQAQRSVLAPGEEEPSIVGPGNPRGRAWMSRHLFLQLPLLIVVLPAPKSRSRSGDHELATEAVQRDARGAAVVMKRLLRLSLADLPQRDIAVRARRQDMARVVRVDHAANGRLVPGPRADGPMFLQVPHDYQLVVAAGHGSRHLRGKSDAAD